MNDPSIRFQFPNTRAAYNAFDTLEELGYRPDFVSQGDCPELAIHIEKNDVQSALEITQAFGGQILDQAAPQEEINIPAHMVTEDFTERYKDYEDLLF